MLRFRVERLRRLVRRVRAGCSSCAVDDRRRAKRRPATPDLTGAWAVAACIPPVSAQLQPPLASSNCPGERALETTGRSLEHQPASPAPPPAFSERCRTAAAQVRARRGPADFLVRRHPPPTALGRRPPPWAAAAALPCSPQQSPCWSAAPRHESGLFVRARRCVVKPSALSSRFAVAANPRLVLQSAPIQTSATAHPTPLPGCAEGKAGLEFMQRRLARAKAVPSAERSPEAGGDWGKVDEETGGKLTAADGSMLRRHQWVVLAPRHKLSAKWCVGVVLVCGCVWACGGVGSGRSGRLRWCCQRCQR